MNTYIIFYQQGNNEDTRNYLELEAYSSSEAQAYVLDDLDNKFNVVSVYERVL